MNLATALFKSSIGRKIIMAVTGLVLLGFVTGHLVGNLHIFGHPDEINGYAAFLQGLGPVLWLVRGTLLACVLLHVWAAVALTLENSRARPQDYGFKHTIQATLASRTMRVTGMVVLAFIAYHLVHFTIGSCSGFFQGETYKSALDHYEMKHDFHFIGLLLVQKGEHVHNVYDMVVLGFQNPIVSAFYILATGLLAFHLWHGIESMCQTFGIKTNTWGKCLRALARVYCLAYFLGSLAIPASILAGCLKPTGAACSSCSSCSAPAEAPATQPAH